MAFGVVCGGTKGAVIVGAIFGVATGDLSWGAVCG